MSKHEQYEELCTLAMIGEVSAAEMQDLRQHLSECADCREQYREFTQFLLPQLSISSDNDATFETGYSTADKDRLRQDFLEAAQKKGRVFSEEAIRGTTNATAPPATPAVSIHARRYVYRYRWAVAASIAVLLFGSGYGTHLVLVQRGPASNHRATDMAAAPQPGNADHGANAAGDTVERLQATNTANTKTIADLQ